MPVIVTTNDPLVVELHPSVAVPDPVTLVGVIAPHVRPAGTVSVRETVPVNPLRAVTVIVEVRVEATEPETDVALIEKSRTVNVAVAEWTRVPLVLVTINV